VKAVGGLEEVPTDCRILSATHKNLEEEVAKGNFRQDLFYRLNVIKLDVPSLSERGNDILLLANFFLKEIARRWELPEAKLSKQSKGALLYYPFPGNVRELENILERACTLSDGEFIEPDDLQLPKEIKVIQSRGFNNTAPEIEPTNYYQPQPQGEKEEILEALDQTRWNRTAAAKVLGMTFRQLRYRIKKYELDQAP